MFVCISYCEAESAVMIVLHLFTFNIYVVQDNFNAESGKCRISKLYLTYLRLTGELKYCKS